MNFMLLGRDTGLPAVRAGPVLSKIPTFSYPVFRRCRGRQRLYILNMGAIETTTTSKPSSASTTTGNAARFRRCPTSPTRSTHTRWSAATTCG
ncbi:hypothetical protein PR202_gb02942 [Eleusine coracana subsp. coracana]|uniref:Uncharacterized protein n=1 Tax=Eleusine coracana subsp. coracana TaxID=191504 RepID=A0AAV5DZX3_ELECO|nr:hypothetical protein PR202_gb02942 [Eleusine coracana subsp. coracana]